MEFTPDHLSRLVETEQRSKSNTKRIDEIAHKQEDLESLTKSVALIANEQEHMRGDISETKEDVKEIKRVVLLHGKEQENFSEVRSDVKELKSKPGKRLEEMWKIIVSAAVGAIITYIAVQLGLR